jgi:hypothetical protein
MIKQMKLSSEGMMKDLAKNKFPGQMYYDARNIRIIATDQQSTFAITNEHGNTLSLTIPTPVIDLENRRISYIAAGGLLKLLPYTTSGTVVPRNELETQYTEVINALRVAKTSGPQVIIGKGYSREDIILFTTDGNGFDCVWELENVSNSSAVNITLKYMRDLNFSKSNPIQAIYNYENKAIEKVYWVDGVNQLRFINLRQSIANKDLEELIDMSAAVVDSVGTFNTSQPKLVEVLSGGSNTSGMVQYGYNLYRINGSQTTISPLSQIIPLGRQTQGGAVNEVVSAMPSMKITSLDKNYTHIKIYAIKYTSYNQIPSVSIISDSLISNYDEIQFNDNGTTVGDLSLAEFLFLGSNVSIPKHIESKNLRMFLFNIKELSFEVNLDTRAYGHNSSGQAVVWSDLKAISTGIGAETNDPSKTITLNTTTYALDEKHDSINKDYDVYSYTGDSQTFGVEGKYLKIEIDRQELGEVELRKNKYLKDREIYRTGIVFYNNKGQSSFPKWVADLKAPQGNLQKQTNKLKVTMKPAFYTWLASLPESEKPIGYRLVRSDRTDSDKTILCQGFINPMIANIKKTTKDTDKTILANLANTSDALKMPSTLRPLVNTENPFVGAKDYHELAFANYTDSSFSQLGRDRTREGFKADSSKDWRAQNIQFNRMMQLFSPEITFGGINFGPSTKLKIVGSNRLQEINCWATEYNPVSKINAVEAKFLNGINSSSAGVNKVTIQGNPDVIHDRSFYGPTNTQNLAGISQVYRKFGGYFNYSQNTMSSLYEIYGSPEITEIGQDSKVYNNDSKFRYANTLRPMLIDDWRDSDDAGSGENQILGANTFGARCVTIVEGPEDSAYPIANRVPYEKMYTNAGLNLFDGGSGTNFGTTNQILIAEFTQGLGHAYIGGIYGGNTIENKSNSTYIAMGDYSPVGVAVTSIFSPGDTFVQEYKIAKMTKTDTELSDVSYNQYTELVSTLVETTVDLFNRNDLSNTPWDNRFQPRESEYHQYNTVYSQQATLVKNSGVGFKFKSINEFDTKIMSSSQKINGEFIDSWTNFLENETRILDGRYGPINGVAKLGDEIYTFQDTAIAAISIEPRVQTTTSDGFGIQIGTGDVLNNHQYISTDSGTKNKWSLASSSGGIYYYDTINRSIGKVGQGVSNLTDLAGLHSFMTNNTNMTMLSDDNPILSKGVSVGYNSIDDEIYMTFLQSANSFTIAYNEKKGAFTSFYDYKPIMYFNKGQRLFSTPSSGITMWQHFIGQRNSFYGASYPSSITYLASPEGERDITFNNLEYKMEMIDNSGLDLPNVTFTKVKVWNDYQDTGYVNLILRKNLKRKFRNWAIVLPRVKKAGANSRDRVRNPWSYIELTFDNPLGNKMIANDLLLSYNEY